MTLQQSLFPAEGSDAILLLLPSFLNISMALLGSFSSSILPETRWLHWKLHTSLGAPWIFTRAQRCALFFPVLLQTSPEIVFACLMGTELTCITPNLTSFFLYRMNSFLFFRMKNCFLLCLCVQNFFCCSLAMSRSVPGDLSRSFCNCCSHYPFVCLVMENTDFSKDSHETADNSTDRSVH